MEETLSLSPVWELIIANGIWAVLFVSLLFYTLKENSKREIKLMDNLINLTNSQIKIVESLKELQLEVRYLSKIIGANKNDNP
ncbi:MAG: Bacteriocin UviB [Dehalococcoidia bacterium]|nr:Bacteriocin UviB [Bacillota bacterium]